MHCGPGLANGLANMHNARRAYSPMVNIVGDQATYHRPLDAPLTADTEGLARAVSQWVRIGSSAETVAADGAAAVQAAMSPPGNIATLILPTDTAWNESAGPAAALAAPPRGAVAPETVRTVALALRTKEPALLLLSGPALGERGLYAAYRIAVATGAKLRTMTQVPRLARGRGRVPIDRIPYAVDRALECVRRHQTRSAVRGQAPGQLLRLSRQAEHAVAEGCTTSRAVAGRAGRGGCARSARRRVRCTC